MRIVRKFFNLKKISLRRLSTINGGRIIYNKFKDKGVKDVFLYSGGAIMPAVDSFYKGDINYYINTHEQSLGHAATGYAKSTGKPGICMVTSGPGLTNMITPITDATNDSTPLIVFSGNVPKKAMGTQAFQECPSVDITKPVTKWSYCVENVNELSDIVDEAFRVSTTGKKGAVHIDLPKCITTATTKIENINNTFIHTDLNYNKNILDFNINKISTLINNSKNPVIIAGQGCNEAYKLLRELSSKGNIPVTTTIHGVGIFDETNNLSLKFLGMHGNPAANFAVQNSDLIINLGSRFDDRSTGNVEKYAPEAYKAAKENRGGIIQVNLNKEELSKNITTHYNFHTKCDLFLKHLLPCINYKERNEWLNRINMWKSKYPFDIAELDDGTLNTQMVIKSINRNLPKNKRCRITTGVGNHQMWAAQFIDYKLPQTLMTSGSLGVMGVGLPYSIGVQIGNPDDLVIDIDGDGSFNHTLSELKTVSNYNLPIKIAVMNDGHMSMVRVWEKLFFNERYTATNLNQNPDYVLLAESFGIESMYCNSKEMLDKNVEYFLNYPGPILCEFKVNTDLCYPLVKPGNALDDMFLYQEENKFDKIDVTQVPS